MVEPTTSITELPRRAPRVVFAGGGTGGHLCPAVAVARALVAEHPRAEVLFLGSGKPLERRIVEPAGFRYEAVEAAPHTAPLRFIWKQARGAWRAVSVLRDFAPDVVLGLGGFASVPGALAGRWLGAPLALFEPNARPGRANVWLSRLAVEAYGPFAGSCSPALRRGAVADRSRRGGALPPDSPAGCARSSAGLGLACPVLGTGVPPGDGLRAADGLSRADARARLGLPSTGRTLLFMGGSQGARPINAWIEAGLSSSALKDRLRDVSVVHLAGTESAAVALRAAWARAGVPAHVAAFLPEVGLAYRAADLAVVRGGAATLAEVLVAGLPARVVPLPGAADDHQTHNARAFAAAGAGDLLAESALDADALRDTLALLEDEDTLATRGRCARAAARPDAAREVARRLVGLAGFETRTGSAARPRALAA